MWLSLQYKILQWKKNLIFIVKKWKITKKWERELAAGAGGDMNPSPISYNYLLTHQFITYYFPQANIPGIYNMV